jgi:hypothetical protein
MDILAIIYLFIAIFREWVYCFILPVLQLFPAMTETFSVTFIDIFHSQRYIRDPTDSMLPMISPSIIMDVAIFISVHPIFQPSRTFKNDSTQIESQLVSWNWLNSIGLKILHDSAHDSYPENYKSHLEPLLML